VRTRSDENRGTARLLALAEASDRLGEADGVDSLTGLVVERAAELVGDAAVMWLLTAGTDTLVCVTSGHRDPAARRHLGEQLPPGRERTTDHTCRAVLATGEPVLLSTEDADSDLAGYLSRRDPGCRPGPAEHLDGLVVVPMRSRGRVVGLLELTREAGRPPHTAGDIVFLQALANIAAAAVDRDRLVDDSATVLDDLRRQTELLDHVSDAVVVLDPDHRVVSWNAAAERIYGYSPGEVLGCDLFALLDTQFLSTDLEPVDRDAALIQAGGDGGWRGELRERRVDGVETEILASFSALPGADGEPAGVVVVNRDVTEQRHKAYLATHDPLTGLPNRAGMADRLRRAIEDSRRAGSMLAVVFLDLNGFKAVNDRLGHEAGDQVLQVTARRLAGAVRSSDMVARLGGDEFVVIAANVSADGARVLGQRLLSASSDPIVLGGEAVVVPPSIGIALSTGDPHEEPDDLLRAADAAMYEAKQHRRGVAFAS
jgi:diguanylate cyclase (GGDEF)-like protein/PAS domain S-box-containing protein